MAAPVETEITTAYQPEQITLSSTITKAITIPEGVHAQIDGIAVYLDDAGVDPRGFYAILEDGALPDDDTIPTANIFPIVGSVRQPIETGIRNPAGLAGGSMVITVWAEEGTPTLYIQPIPSRP